MKVATLIALVSAFIAQSSANIIDRCNAAGMMALTFDDGPASFTPQLLDILKSKGVRATFHLTTKYLTDPNVQSTIQAIAAAGHLIGLRTENDWDLLKMSDDQIRSSIARQANVMASFIGYYPKFVRLSYGGYDDRVIKAVESTGAVVTTHNIDTYDYSNDGNRVVNAVQLATSLLAPGAGSFIVVQHDGVQQSVAVTGNVIDIAKKSAYKLVTLDSCLGMGDMTKNKVALKGGSGKEAPLPIAGQTGGKIPGGSATVGGASPIVGGGSAAIGGGALDADEDAVKGKSKNAGAATKASGFGLAAVVAIAVALAL